MRRLFVLLCCGMIFLPGWSQLKLDTSLTAQELVEDVLLGGRVDVSNIQIKGRKLSYSKFIDVSPRPLIGEGILFSTGHIEDVLGPNDRPNSGLHQGGKGNYELSLIATYPTYDASGIEFDFVPEHEWFQFNFVFASEEYIEYVNSHYNDVFAFFITGPGYETRTNLAVIPGTKEPITINTVNHGLNKEFYIDNNVFGRAGMPMAELPKTVDSTWVNTFAFDGLTKPIQIGAKVKPGAKYHIAIYIADVSDGAFDSAVFLEGKSFTSLPEEMELREAILADEASNFRRTFSPAVIGESVPEELIFAEAPPEIPDPIKEPKPIDPVVEVEVPEIEETIIPEKEEQAINTGGVDFDWKLLVTFDYDSYALDGKAEQQLEAGLMYIREHPGMKLRVRGHTCNKGNKQYNQRLSKRRAESVATYLSKAGIDRKLIETEAWDFQLPQVDNDSEGNRSQNRRVEISFVPVKGG